jgi:acetyl-CoA carboxylase biotin carboxyl carrier protein
MSARRAGDGEPAAAPGRDLDALADEILPALIARLRASGLAELEVRHAGWRVRLRRDLRSQRRSSRPASGEAAHGEAPDDAADGTARSPAVGYFSPGPALRVGASVQAGDPLGDVDVLGIPVEVAAPVSGLVSSLLVEAGEAVEFGQALARIETLPEPGPASDDGAVPATLSTDAEP